MTVTASLVLAFLSYNLKSIIIIIIFFLFLLLIIIITLPLITMALRLLCCFLVHFESLHLLVHALQRVILLHVAFFQLSMQSQEGRSNCSYTFMIVLQ